MTMPLRKNFAFKRASGDEGQVTLHQPRREYNAGFLQGPSGSLSDRVIHAYDEDGAADGTGVADSGG
jgi:hypothetical protein